MDITPPPHDRDVSEQFIARLAVLVEVLGEPRTPHSGAKAIIDIIEIEARHERERLRAALMAPPVEPLPF